jgi:alpha-L-fucosidase 2
VLDSHSGFHCLLPEDAAVAAQALSIVSKQKAVFASPPILIPTRKVPDAPLLGNGDLGVAIGCVIERQKYFGLGEPGGGNVNIRPVAVTNAPERYRFYISKNDFWKSKNVYPNAHRLRSEGLMSLSRPW